MIIVNVLGHLKGVGRLTSNFLHGGGMDVFWNDPLRGLDILWGGRVFLPKIFLEGSLRDFPKNSKN